MKKLFGFLILSSLCLADVQFGGSYSVNSSYTQLDANTFSASIDTHYVQRIAIRVVPGYCSKIYIAIGGAPDTTNYTNVIKVLYPNCSGGLSDEYVLEDRSGNDGIDSRNFYISGTTSGDVYLVEFEQSGTLGSQVLYPCMYGAGYTSANNLSWNSNITWAKPTCSPFGTQYVAVAQFNIIPGFSGKFIVVTPYGAEKELYPNNGTVTGNITDRFEFLGRPGAGNTINAGAGGIGLQRFVTGELISVALWQYQ